MASGHELLCKEGDPNWHIAQKQIGSIQPATESLTRNSELSLVFHSIATRVDREGGEVSVSRGDPRAGAKAFRNWSNFWWGLVACFALPALFIWVDPLRAFDGRGAFGDEPAVAVGDLPYFAFPVVLSLLSYLYLVRPVVLVYGDQVTVRNPFRTYTFGLIPSPTAERTFMGYLRFRWPDRSIIALATEVPLIADLGGSAGVQRRLLGSLQEGEDVGPDLDVPQDHSLELARGPRASFRLWRVDLVFAALVGIWVLYVYAGYRAGYPYNGIPR